MRYPLLFIICVLLAVIAMAPAGSAAGPDTCPGCGMVWEDTCVMFEQNNETAYNEAVLRSFAPVYANLTPVADYANMSWSEAFLSAHTLLKERYVFSQWREVDWDTLYRTWAPAIADAEKKQDKAAYFRALKGYITAIPDGHIGILPATGDFGAKYADIGGDYGLSVLWLDSGNIVVSYVAPGSAAEAAEIRPGDRVTAWNGKEIHEAINATPYIWAVKKPSTAEGIRLHQQRFLTRGPVGATATVTVMNATGMQPKTITLTAYDDGYENLKKTSAFFLGTPVNDYGAEKSWEDIVPQISNETVTVRTLPNGYTYIRIYDESFDVYQPFKAAMLAAIANKTPGIVLDFRFNNGGEDNLASCFAGWFVERPVFYEYATKYDPGRREYIRMTEVWTAPQPERFTGPVAVLVSPDTISSGEGVPMVLSKTGRGTIVSFYGTNGAFGMNGIQAAMPLGQYLLFPDGASLDINGTIQTDSNAALAGGVPPQIRVPVNEDTVARSMAGEDVQLTYALQWLDSRQGQGGSPVPPVPAATTQKASAGIAAGIFAVAILIVVAARK